MVEAAMEVDGDNSVKDDFYPVNHSDESFSSEDVAWADSCIVKDSEQLDGDWSSIADVILDIIASQATSSVTYPPFETKDSNNVSDNAPEMKASNALNIEGSETSENSEVLESIRDDANFNLPEGSDVSQKPVVLESIRDDSNFNSTDFTESELADLGGFWEDSINRMDVSEDIFKVWDMHFASEEDEFVKQLNKALEETAALNGDGTTPVKHTFEDIISSMADLNLQQSSN